MTAILSVVSSENTEAEAEDIADDATAATQAVLLAVEGLMRLEEGGRTPCQFHYEGLRFVADRASDIVERLAANVQRREPRWNCGRMGWEGMA